MIWPLINIEAIALCAYFFRDAFAGAMRYYLDRAGLGVAWFLPDLLAFVCVAAFVYRYGVHRRSRLAIATTAVIFFSTLIGYFFLGTIEGLLSSIKMMVPVFVGFLFAERYVGDYRKTLHFVHFLLYASMLGILLSSIVELPWVGYTFAAITGERQATTVWWQGETVRLSGFAADSTMAAFFVMISFVLTSINRSTIWALVVGPVALAAIQLTTNKTYLLVLGVYILALVMVRSVRRETGFRLLRLMAVGSYACILVPVMLMILLGGVDLERIDPLLFSMQDRINNSWQKPFVFMAEIFPIGYVTGCGVGCFNYPQDLFAPSKLAYIVPVDNFYVGTYLMFGPIFLVFVALVIRAAMDVVDVYKLTAMIVVNLYTITILSYGPASGLIMISLSFSAVFASRAMRRSVGAEAVFQAPPRREVALPAHALPSPA
ncbi:hypothetical protein [Aureimonas sp. SK2]|uniref:hypothetical protein n=1 Tax=Aureimonas sp. SK2 TaxID=3015992 RepID=UPI002443CDC9|nr:hypothetical protein [Aureimonas sp. SK2]